MASPVSVAYSEGHTVYNDGLSREDNPFPSGSNEFAEWDDAWDICRIHDDPDVQKAINEMLGIITIPDPEDLEDDEEED